MIRIESGPSEFGPRDDLVLIQVVKKNNNKTTKETTWAECMGPNLYRVKGPLHLIAGLNFEDIVKAVPLPGDSIPSVSKVISTSGFRTLHFVFCRSVTLRDQERTLEGLARWKVKHSSVFERFYTLEVPPTEDYEALREYLHTLKLDRLLIYEPDTSLDDLLRYRFIDS